MKYEKLIIISLIIGLILPVFSFAQNLPENLEDIKGIGKRIWEGFLSGLKKAWQDALKIWQKIWGFFKNLWEKYFFPWLKNLWQKIWNFFSRIKEGIQKIGETVWEKLKRFIGIFK